MADVAEEKVLGERGFLNGEEFGRLGGIGFLLRFESFHFLLTEQDVDESGGKRNGEDTKDNQEGEDEPAGHP